MTSAAVNEGSSKVGKPFVLVPRSEEPFVLPLLPGPLGFPCLGDAREFEGNCCCGLCEGDGDRIECEGL